MCSDVVTQLEVGITTGQPRRTSRRHPRRRESSASDDDVKEHTRNIAGPAAFVNGILALRVFDRHRYDRETMGLGATIARRSRTRRRRTSSGSAGPVRSSGPRHPELGRCLATSSLPHPDPLPPGEGTIARLHWTLSRREREASESERVRGVPQSFISGCEAMLDRRSRTSSGSAGPARSSRPRARRAAAEIGSGSSSRCSCLAAS